MDGDLIKVIIDRVVDLILGFLIRKGPTDLISFFSNLNLKVFPFGYSVVHLF